MVFLNLLLFLQCVVGYPKRPKSYFLTPSRKLIGKSLARRQGLSFAKAAWQSERYRQQIVSHIQRQISAEAKLLCSTSNACSLRGKTADSLTAIDWEELYNELSRRAPVLFSALGAVLRTRSISQPGQKIAVCISASVLLFRRNRNVSLIQRATAMILYAGHSSKNVSLCSLVSCSMYVFCF